MNVLTISHIKKKTSGGRRRGLLIDVSGYFE